MAHTHNDPVTMKPLYNRQHITKDGDQEIRTFSNKKELN